MSNCICKKHKDELSALTQEGLMSQVQKYLERNLEDMQALHALASKIENDQKILALLNEEMDRRL